MSPPASEQKFNYLGFTQARWLELLAELGEKPFHAGQIMKWLHHRFVTDFAEMTDISKSLRDQLAVLGEAIEPDVLQLEPGDGVGLRKAGEHPSDVVTVDMGNHH